MYDVYGKTEVEDSECYHNTVFIRIVVTINFSLAGVRLLIKGGSYSRVAFINNYFGVISLGAIINAIELVFHNLPCFCYGAVG